MTQYTKKPISIGAVNVLSLADISEAVTYGLEHGSLLLSEANLCPAFFNLQSGIAGEMMQKFVNYRIPLAIIVTAPEAHGARFFSSEAKAREWLGATC